METIIRPRTLTRRQMDGNSHTTTPADSEQPMPPRATNSNDPDPIVFEDSVKKKSGTLGCPQRRQRLLQGRDIWEQFRSWHVSVPKRSRARMRHLASAPPRAR